MDYRSLARGAGQGASLGWSDEVLGALLADKARLDRGPLPQAIGPWQVQTSPWATMVEEYKQNRDQERAANEAAMSRSPGEYLSGNLLGSLPYTPVSGVWPNMVQAAATGAGSAGTPEDIAPDAARDMAITGGISAASPWLGMAAGKIIKFPGSNKAERVVLDEAVTSPSNPLDRVLSYIDDESTRLKLDKAASNPDVTEPYIGRDISNPIYLRGGQQDLDYSHQIPTRQPKYPAGEIGKNLLEGGADPFAWMDTKYQQGLNALKAHSNDRLHINTRSDLIAHDDYISHLNPKLHSVDIVTTGENDRVNRVLAGGSPSFSRQVKAAEKLAERGVPVRILVEKIPGMKPELNGVSMETQKRLLEKGIVVEAVPSKISDFSVLDKVFGGGWKASNKMGED